MGFLRNAKTRPKNLPREDYAVNKTELVKSLAEKAGVTQKEAMKVLDATVTSIQEALSSGEKVQIIGFGTFEVRDRRARKVISPATGEEIEVPATRVPAFKPGKSLKEAVVVKEKKAGGRKPGGRNRSRTAKRK